MSTVCALFTDVRQYAHTYVRTDGQFKQFNRLPETGTWQILPNSTQENYELDFCKFEPVDSVRCLAKKKVKYILVIGDSQGRYYYSNLKYHLVQDGAKCKKVRGEREVHEAKRKEPDLMFFARGDPVLEEALEGQRRGCRSCRSDVYRCFLFIYHQKYILLLFITSSKPQTFIEQILISLLTHISSQVLPPCIKNAVNQQ